MSNDPDQIRAQIAELLGERTDLSASDLDSVAARLEEHPLAGRRASIVTDQARHIFHARPQRRAIRHHGDRHLAQLLTGRSEAKKSRSSLFSPIMQKFRKKA